MTGLGLVDVAAGVGLAPSEAAEGLGPGVPGVPADSASIARVVATIWSAVVPNGNAPRNRPAASTRKTSAVWLIE